MDIVKEEESGLGVRKIKSDGVEGSKARKGLLRLIVLAHESVSGCCKTRTVAGESIGAFFVRT